jgi:DNA-binding ferritin-like protein
MSAQVKKRTVAVAFVAVLLAVCWIEFVRSRNSPAGHGEEVSNPTSLPAAQEVTGRPIVSDEVSATMPSASKPEATTNQLVYSNLYARVASGDIPQVNREKLESYIKQNRRSVDSLLGAFRASNDEALLAEAKEKFPDDPRVQFAAAFKTESLDERRQWLEKLKQSDPDNALANYLLADGYLKAGQNEQGLQEITAAAGKGGFENYLVDFIQNAEEAYQAGGYSAAEAKTIASISALLPEQARLKAVGTDLVELAKRYQQAGDEASAQAVLQMGLDLGHRLDASPQTTLIQELVGMAIERLALNAMNPNDPYGSTGQTVNDRLDALIARRKSYQEMTRESTRILENMSDEDVAHYFDRIRLYGDVAAMRWVMNQSPQQ